MYSYNNKFITSIYGYMYILLWGDSILQISSTGGNDLMYKILGEEDIVPHSMVSEKWINTNNVSDYNCGYSSNDTW